MTVIAADCEILEYNLGENEWTEAIKEQVAHLTELTNHLVFLSRMDEENRKTVFSDFSLSEVATEVANTSLRWRRPRTKNLLLRRRRICLYAAMWR